MSSYIGFATRDDAYDIIIIHAYTAATHGAIISVELLGGSRLNQCRADLEHDTLITPRFRYR